MAKKSLEETVASAAQEFALQVIEAVKGASLQELMALQKAPKKRGRKPGRPKKAKAVAKKKPGRPPKSKTVAAKRTVANKKRSINYPKCAYPGCGKNRYAKGKGFCGDHFKEFKTGKIKDADKYKKKK